MRTRVVTNVHKQHGRIVELWGRDWGPVLETTAIDEIEAGERAYAVADTPLNPIYVVDWMYGKYLRTHPNSLRNLEDLSEPPARFGTRIVTEVHLEHGAIGELLGRGWGPVPKETAIDQIEHRRWAYAVDDDPLNPIFVVDSMHGKYLRTPPNPLRNLEDLAA